MKVYRRGRTRKAYAYKMMCNDQKTYLSNIFASRWCKPLILHTVNIRPDKSRPEFEIFKFYDSSNNNLEIRKLEFVVIAHFSFNILQLQFNELNQYFIHGEVA